MTCELTLEVMPETELPVLEEIEVERLNAKVTEEMVESLAHDIRRQHSLLEPVERSAEEGDVVSVNFTTRVLEDTASIESEPQKSDIDLSDENIRSEVRVALIGKKSGETTETEFEVEADYRDSTVAGKRVHYTMTVEDVKARILPELDVVFFKKLFGEGTEITTTEAFLGKLRDDLLSRLKAENENQAANRAVDQVSKRSILEVPDTLVERQVQLLKARDEEEAKRRFGVDVKELLRREGEEESAYETLIRSRATEMVRRTLVLDAIGKKYEVEVTKDDFEAEVDHRSALYGIDRNRLLGILYKDRKSMSQVLDDLRYSKITDRLMTLVKVKDVDELSDVRMETAEDETPSKP